MLTSPSVGASFVVLYTDDNPARTQAFCQLFDTLVTIRPVASRQAALVLLASSERIDAVVINERLGIASFLPFMRGLTRHRHTPVLVLIDSAGQVSAAGTYRDDIIDILPYQQLESAVRSRLIYLMQKKLYRETPPDLPESTRMRMPVGKRLFDIAGASFMLLGLTPVLGIVSLLIRFDSPGPILYRSRRVGMGYRQFDMFKFRTMRHGADKLIGSMASQSMYAKVLAPDEDELCEPCRLAGRGCQQPLYANYAVQICELIHRRNQQNEALFMKFMDDPRVTRLGRFLRNSSIDELPQLLNILRGDMSFVGNRPLPPYEAEKLTTDSHARRFAAPAGLTGLWQVTKRGQAALSEAERIQLDVQYARSFSLLTDLRILGKTLIAIWQKENV